MAEDRLARLERRVAALEAELSALRPASQEEHTPRSAWSIAGPPVIAPEPPPAFERTPPPLSRHAPPARVLSFSELEERLSGRLLAWAGGIALVLGSLFFLSLAFSRGWIGPELRVLIGFAVAAVSVAAGAWLMERPPYRTPAVVVVAVGIAVGMLTLFAATRLYDFIPPVAALLGALALAAGAAGIAVRAGSQTVAMLGLVAALAAPPLFGAPPDIVTVLFIGTVLVATAAISLWRSWPGMSSLAFFFAAPQVAFWVGDDPPLPLALAGIAAFWLVNAVAAGGEAMSGRRGRIALWSPALLALNGLQAIGLLQYTLRDESDLVQAVGLVVLAVAHAALALPFVLRAEGRHPFAILAAGGAVATLIVAVGLELGGPYQPIAWLAIGVAVAWAAERLDDRLGAWAAAVPLGLALLHLLRVEYPAADAYLYAPTGVPFVSPEGAVLVITLVAIAVVTELGARAARRTSPIVAGRSPQRIVVIGSLVAAGLVAYVAPFELWAAWAVAVWAALAVGLLVLGRQVGRDRPAADLAVASGVALMLLGAAAALAYEIPPSRLTLDAAVGGITPLLNDESGALAAVVVALVLGARTTHRHELGAPLALAAAGIATYVVSVAVVDVFALGLPSGNAGEITLQAQVALSITWVVIGVGAFAAGLIRSVATARAFGLGLLGLATLKVFLLDLAALDVAYRVLSFLGLGLALLGSSFLAARLRRQASR